MDKVNKEMEIKFNRYRKESVEQLHEGMSGSSDGRYEVALDVNQSDEKV